MLTDAKYTKHTKQNKSITVCDSHAGTTQASMKVGPLLCFKFSTSSVLMLLMLGVSMTLMITVMATIAVSLTRCLATGVQ